jgi:thiol-disulfide isomerase/thioredoxin
MFVALVAGYHTTCRSSAGAGQAPSGANTDGDVTLPGVDVGSLTPREKRDWSAMVSELLAPCPNVPVGVAQCVREGRKCAACLPAARLLVKQVRAGRSRSQAEDAFFSRFAADRVRTIDVGDSPYKGPASAPITIVEWADFECPHCRHASPVFEKLVDDYAGKVRLVFKVYPLPGHPHGDSTARAVVAAMNQGKFWEMHHALFAHQNALEPRDVESYAKDIGLDLKKFKADLETEATVDRVARDRKQAEKLAITGTPTVYINGREYHFGKFDLADDLTDWIKLEIELTGN